MSGILSAIVSQFRKRAQERMPRTAKGPATPLRAARLAGGRGWSLRAVARRLHSNPTSLSEWERDIGQPPPEIQSTLCKLYHALPDDLGFPKEERPDAENPSEGISRRAFLTAAVLVPLALGIHPTIQPGVTGSTLETLAEINAHYRALQGEGIIYSREQLQAHIASIEQFLTSTLDLSSRRELYRLLCQALLLACGGRTPAERLTLTERALGVAQQSGDTLLTAAILSHLGQLYTFRLQRPDIAEHYLAMSAQLARSDRELSAWVAAQRAEAAAMQQQIGETTRYLDIASDNTRANGDDRFYTAWSRPSLDAYRGACLIHMGQYEKAAAYFQRIMPNDLTRCRSVVPLIDMAHVYTELGDVENASVTIIAALQAAQTTGHEALIPRLQGIADRFVQRHPAELRAMHVQERFKAIPQMAAV
jgi:tetratricopeptide (TPR) repeat protein